MSRVLDRHQTEICKDSLTALAHHQVHSIHPSRCCSQGPCRNQSLASYNFENYTICLKFKPTSCKTQVMLVESFVHRLHTLQWSTKGIRKTAFRFSPANTTDLLIEIGRNHNINLPVKLKRMKFWKLFRRIVRSSHSYQMILKIWLQLKD